MNDIDFREYCLKLLHTFSNELSTRTRDLPENDSLRELAMDFSAMSAGVGDMYLDGPSLVSRLFTTYPDFAPTLPRELLWFFGGECLHYMPDEEIAEFEKRFANNT